ncbi:MAG: hypothetical protein AAF823_05965 [Planctomycetota bacterium]
MLEDVLGVAGSSWWVFGVHQDGTVGSSANPYEADNTWTGRSRLPLMGESAERPGNIGNTGNLGRATHYSKLRLRDDINDNGGTQNYLFTDVSAASFIYGL